MHTHTTWSHWQHWLSYLRTYVNWRQAVTLGKLVAQDDSSERVTVDMVRPILLEGKAQFDKKTLAYAKVRGDKLTLAKVWGGFRPKVPPFIKLERKTEVLV